MPYIESFDNPAEFFNRTPFPANGYSVATNSITFGCSDHGTAANKFFTNLNSTQAALTTGSTAQVIFGLLDAIQTRYNSLDTADRPAKLRIARSVSTDSTTGELIYSYDITCRVNPTNLVAVNS